MVMHFLLILRECNLTAIIFQTCSFRVEIYFWRTRLLKPEKPSEEKTGQQNIIFAFSDIYYWAFSSVPL